VLALSGIAALIIIQLLVRLAFYEFVPSVCEGIDARAAGLIMISQPLAMALLSPVAGKLSDRKNPGVIASAGMGITGIGLILLCFINASTPFYLIICLLILLGVDLRSFHLPTRMLS